MKKSLLLLIIILFIFVNSWCIYTVLNTHNRYSVELNGSDNMKLSYNHEYEDEGFKVIINGEEVSLDELDSYDIISDLDVNKLGTYQINYDITFKGKNYHFTRTIEVVDEEAPVVETNLDEVTLGYCNNELISNLEYTASDNFDGILTDKIEKNETDDKIILSVTDSNGNNTIKELKKIIGEKPNDKIVLNGRASLSVEIGGTYTEQGAYVTDGCGEKIEGEVVTSGSVDTNKVGKYTITYKLKNNDNIKNTRTVTVYKETAKQATGKGIIYLTFDDGPGAYTSKILNTLDKYNIKATFFVTNQFPSYKSMIGEEYKRGHSVGVHSLTHSYKWDFYYTVDAYWNDFNAMNSIIEQQTGHKANFLRFPGGTSNHVARVGMSNIVNAVNAKGLRYYDWNVSVEDAGSCVSVSDKVTCVVNKFKNGLNPNRENIVLMHDIKWFTADGLEKMIQYGINNGYTFKAITDDTNPVHFKPYK